MIVSSLLPPEASPRLLPFGLFVIVASALRATSALSLVPLLGALFSPQPHDALFWLAILAVSVVAGWLLERILVIRAFDLGFSMMTSMNGRLVEHLLSVPIGWFGAQQQTQARRALSGAVPELFASSVNLTTQASIALVLPFAIGVGLLFVAWPLGLATLIAAPLLIGALILGGRMMRRAEADFDAASGEAAARIDEFARAQLVLRAAGRTETNRTPLGAAIDAQKAKGLRVLWWTLPGTLLFSLAMQATLLSLVVALATAYLHGMIDAGRAVALIAVMLRFLEPLNTLAELFPALESTRAAAQRTLALLEVPVQRTPIRDSIPSSPAIEVANIQFHANGTHILDGVSFSIAAGTTTAIVGPSGSGKSTVLSLIARLHDVSEGEIRVSGNDVRAYEPATLMDQLSIVFQNVQLFEGGIAENIRLARPDASDEELNAVAATARVDEIVERLGGWDAPVGESGNNLSGGERQRVSIARALLKNAPILLLDEATSGLDTLNEAAVATALNRFGHRTVVVVAHRLETIARADHIVFLEAGRVVEAGARTDLIAADGRFAAYWNSRALATDWKLTS